MEFPLIRNRRSRINQQIRDLFAETTLTANDLIQPFFIIEGKALREPISSMPGIERLSIDQLIIDAKICVKLGIKGIILFPSIEKVKKSIDAVEALNSDNLICRAIRELKKEVPNLIIFADVALDPYTIHGHDGLIDENGYVKNDDTLDVLTEQALILASTGCDVISPSDMMDGRIVEIRMALEEAGYVNTMVAAYSAKYASHYYGPFRDGVQSRQSNGIIDKGSYQIDYRNSNEAIREVQMDISEGADFCIIKPGLLYLDIVAKAKALVNIPLISYHVSGEYALLKLAAEQNIINYDAALIEALYAFKRAGCSAIITYAAMDAAKILQT